MVEAVLKITEFQRVPQQHGGNVPVYDATAGGFVTRQTDMSVTVGGAAEQSAAFNARTHFVDLLSDTDGYVLSGSTNPTATAANGIPIIADQRIVLAVTPADKLSFIA